MMRDLSKPPTEPTVVAVLWRRGNHLTITHEDGSKTSAIAGPETAQRIAEDAELILGASQDGTCRWGKPAPAL